MTSKNICNLPLPTYEGVDEEEFDFIKIYLLLGGSFMIVEFSNSFSLLP